MSEEVKETLVAEAPAEAVEEKSAAEVLYDKEDSADKPAEAPEEKTEDSEEKVATSEETDAKGEDAEETADEQEKAEYSLELKEESLLDNSFVEGIKTLAKEHNLSNEQAQELLSKQEEAVQGWVDSQVAEVERQKETWKSQVIEDKTMGGDNLEATVKAARGVIDRFANEEVKELLRVSGYGNHPEIVRFLSSVGRAMSDDSLVMAQAKETPKSAVEVFYGSND